MDEKKFGKIENQKKIKKKNNIETIPNASIGVFGSVITISSLNDSKFMFLKTIFQL